MKTRFYFQKSRMERFPLKSSVPKMGTTYQSVYKKVNIYFQLNLKDKIKKIFFSINIIT